MKLEVEERAGKGTRSQKLSGTGDHEQEWLRQRVTGSYMFKQIPYEHQIRRAVELIKNVEFILIGAGAGRGI